MCLAILDHVVVRVTVTVLQGLVRLSFQLLFLGADSKLSVQGRHVLRGRSHGAGAPKCQYLVSWGQKPLLLHPRT